MSFRLRWTRIDSVLMRVFILLAMAFSGLPLVLGLAWIASLIPADSSFGMNRITVSPPVDMGETSPDVVPQDPDVTVDGTQRMILTFHDPGILERLLLVLPQLVFASLALACLYLLLRILNSLSVGDPFVRANVRRIHVMASLVIVGALFYPFVDAFRGLPLQHGVVPPEGLVLFEFSFGQVSVPLVVLLVGLALAALGEIFRRGTEMRDDVEGLV